MTTQISLWTSIYYVLILFVSAITVVISWVVIYLYQKHSRFSHIPGPPRDSFFIGNIPTFRRWITERRYFFAKCLDEWSRIYGSTYVIFFIHQPIIYTHDPGAVKELLVTGEHSKPWDQSALLGFLYGQRFIGHGIIVELDNKIWSKRRALMNPAFHRKFLRGIMHEFNDISDQLVDKLRGFAVDETRVDIAEHLHHAALDIIGKVAFGKELRSLHDETSPFPHAIYMAMNGLSSKLKDPFIEYKFWSNRAYKEEVRQACRILRNSGEEWIAERRQLMRSGESVTQDILTLIIEALDNNPETMCMEDVLDDFVTFFVAGQETTANAMSFIVYELTRRPEIVEKLQLEIESVLDGRTDIEFEDIGKLEYMTMVIKESLRLYPPATVLFRATANNVLIEGYSVPKDTHVAVSPFITGRRANPEPMEFRPERFHSTCEYRPGIYEFFPFSLGPRNCIGQNFAQIEMKVFLVKLLLTFDMQLTEDYELELSENTTLRPRNGVPCTLTVRQ